MSRGIVNENYYPRVDQAYIRDMGSIVTDGADFFSEEKRPLLLVSLAGMVLTRSRCTASSASMHPRAL